MRRPRVTFLQRAPEIDGSRIGVAGSSFGAAVAVYTGGVDERIAAVISHGGWGDGETKFRASMPRPRPGSASPRMMERGKAAKAKADTIMVPRFDIVPIPQHLRTNLAQNSIMEFPFDTVESMYDFRANDVVGKIAPRPLAAAAQLERLR